jgi:hypothetical protein
MPEMTPVEAFSLSPGGSDPEMMENVKGFVPPVTCRVEEYAEPSVALPDPQAPQSRLMGDPTTAMLHVAVSELPFESVTLAVNA